MNEDQLKVFEKVKRGNSVFISGSAGVGKSFTIENIVSWAKASYKTVGVTAAIIISGRTLHSFLGIGLAKKSAYEIFLYVRKKFPNTIFLIIDEVTM